MTTTDETVLSLRGVTDRYGDKLALNDVSFSVMPGLLTETAAEWRDWSVDTSFLN